MRILSVTPDFQHPIVPGSHRHYHFIKELSKRHEVTLFTLANKVVPKAALDEMRSYTKDIHIFSVEEASELSRLAKAIHRKRVIRRMRDEFKELAGTGMFDVVLFHGKILAKLIADPELPIVVDFCDATSMRKWSQMRFESPVSIPRNFVQYLAARRNERSFLRKGDQVAFISARDRAATVGANSRSHVIPNGVDLDFWHQTCRQGEPNTLALTGVMSYRPNEDAALLLMRRIMPRLRRELTDPKLLLIGRAPSAQMKQEAAAQDDITVTGFVDDVRPWMGRAEVFVAPIQFASGMQNKVLEAMAMELPVVTTSVVASGIQVDGLDNVPMIIADKEKDFAEAVIRLLNDPAERKRLGEAGRAYVKRHFSWIESAAKFEALCLEALGPNAENR